MLQHKLDHARCTAIAAEMLGSPVRTLVLDWELESVLRRRARLEARIGIGGDHALLRFQSGRKGHALAQGAERYRLETPSGTVRIVRVIAPRLRQAAEETYEFWAVAESQYRTFYATLRCAVRRRQRHIPPLMREDDRCRLWANTIGFLKQTQHRLREFGVPAKRGVLLLGEPGNGKTMACRWLRWHCNRLALSWRNVTAEEFENERKNGSAHELFELHRPGIVFFDDVDMALRRRQHNVESPDASTFLSGLDGLDLHHGVVYVFTTNARLLDLDSAFLRPGRIDLSLEFRRPDAALRRQFMAEHWHPEVSAALDLEAVVAQTDGLSSAELDEIKRLMVLEFLASGQWNWQHAWTEFRRGRNDSPATGDRFPSSRGYA